MGVTIKFFFLSFHYHAFLYYFTFVRLLMGGGFHTHVCAVVCM